nr:hypothetical protein [Tanacetum cinerariifolium]
MGIPNENQLKFNSIKDAKKLLEAVEKRFSRNAATKKTQRNLLKQQYENFTAPSSEILDQTFDRLQKLMSQLDLEEKLSQEDVNQNTKGFVSSSNNNTSSTNGAVNTAQAVNTTHGVSTTRTQVNASYSTNIDNLSDVVICSFFAGQPNSPQLVHEDLEQINPDDMEEMDLRWQMAILTMRAKRFLKNTGRKLTVNGNETIGFDKFKNGRAEEGPNHALMAFSSSSFNSKVSIDSTCSKSCLKTVKLLKSQNDHLLKDLKKSESMVLVPPPYTGNFMPLTPELSFTALDEFVNKPVVEKYKAKSSEEEPNVVRKNNNAPIIEGWVSDNEEEDVTQLKIEKKIVRPSIVKIEFVKSKQQGKTARKTVKQVEQNRQNTHNSRGNQRN